MDQTMRVICVAEECRRRQCRWRQLQVEAIAGVKMVVMQHGNVHVMDEKGRYIQEEKNEEDDR